MMLKIGDKLYRAASLDDLSLADILRLDVQIQELRPGTNWGDVQKATRGFDEQSDEEAEEHPLSPLISAITIWATRRAGGDDVTLLEAASTPMNQIEVVPDPEDRKPGKAKAGKKAQTPATDSEPVAVGE